MKAEELATQLRIGNLLYYEGATHIARVELIHNKHFDCRDEYGGFTPNGNYEPIPLSEDVLLKCGFHELYKSEFTIRYELLNNPKIEYKWNNTFGWNLFCQGWCIENIKYLHQLQNAVFFLNGEELEVSI